MPSQAESEDPKQPHARPFLAATLVSLAGLAAAWMLQYSIALAPFVSLSEGMAGHEENIQLTETSFPYYFGPDSYYWLHYTHKLIQEGTLRARSCNLDNGTTPRENHWSSLNCYYLIALGAIAFTASDLSLIEGITEAGYWSNPILLSLVIVATSFAGVFTFGWRPTFLAVLILSTSSNLIADFAYARPDHQSWHLLFTFGVLFCFATAMKQYNVSSDETPPGRIKSWILVAGLLSGLFMWTGAFMALCLIFLFFTCTVFLLGANWALTRRTDPPVTISLLPNGAWRLWGITTSVTAVIFWLWEYFPHHLGWRLEVNHPVHALAILAIGEFFERLQSLIVKREFRRDSLIALAVCTLLGALPLLMILAGGSVFFKFVDPLFMRYMERISELHPYIVDLPTQGDWSWQSAGAFFLPFAGFISISGLLLLNAFHYFYDKNGARHLIKIGALPHQWIFFVLALIFLLLTLFHAYRWSGFFIVATAISGLILISNSTLREHSKCYLFLLLPPLFALTILYSLGINQLEKDIFIKASQRLFGQRLSKKLQESASHDGKIIVVSSLSRATMLLPFSLSEIHTVGSLYWENIEGLEDSAAFFGSTDESVSRRIALDKALTHVIVRSNSIGDVMKMHYLYSGEKNSSDKRLTMMVRLAHPKPRPPEWLELMSEDYFSLMADGETFLFRIYRVVPGALIREGVGEGEPEAEAEKS